MCDSATSSTAAAASQGDGCGRHHRHDVGVPRLTDAARYTCFYFTVFFSNNPPIFHSNRIPPERLGIRRLSAAPAASLPGAGEGSTGVASSSSPSSPCPTCQQQYWKSVFGEPGGDRAARRGMGYPYPSGLYAAAAETEGDGDGAAPVVGDYRSATAAVEEVPQQTLQSVAFPTAFGSCGGACALPIRTCGRRTRSTSAVVSLMASSPGRAASPEGPQSNPPTPPPLRSSSVTNNGKRSDGDTSAEEADGGRAQPSSMAALTTPATGSNAIGSFFSTVGTSPLSDTATFVNEAAPNETVAVAEAMGGACTVAGDFRPTLSNAKWEDRGTAVVRIAHDRDAAATIMAAAPRQGLELRTQPQQQPIAAAKVPSKAEGKAPPRPQRLMPTTALTSVLQNMAHSPACAPAAASSGSLLTPAPGEQESSPSPNAPQRRPNANASTGPHTNAQEAASATLAARAPPQEGPPWNMKVEEVRSARGELRYYRIILTVSFAALVTTHTGLMHSMQTRSAAVALVVLCPPCGLHFRFLLHHVDILRSVLNRTTEFAIRTVQRFFCLLYSPTQKPNGSQQQILRCFAAQLETHPEAFETYQAVKTELKNALSLRFPLPPLAPATSAWVVPMLMRSSPFGARTRDGSKQASAKSPSEQRDTSATLMCRSSTGGASASLGKRLGAGAAPSDLACSAPPPLADILHEAASSVCEYSEGFASAFICGLLSLTEDGVGSAGLRARRRVGNSVSANAGAAAAMPAAISPTSPNVNGVSPLPLCAQHGASPTVAREGSPLLPCGGGVSGTRPGCAPEWLSRYGAYWSSVAEQRDPLHSSCDGVINFGKPVPMSHEKFGRAGSGSVDDLNEDCAALKARAPAITISSKAPTNNPTTIDVSCTAAASSPRTTAQVLHGGKGATALTGADTAVSTGTPFSGAKSGGVVARRSRNCESTPSSPAAPRTVAAFAAAPPAPNAAPPPPPKAVGSSTPLSSSKEDEYLIHRGRLGRVVIFTRDGVLARRLLLIAAFLWGSGGGGAAIGRGEAAWAGVPGRGTCSGQQRLARTATEDVVLRNEEAQHMYETAVAAAVSSAEYPNVPVQWVAEEFSEARISTLCSRFSPENALLVVVPRQLQCRRLYLRKYVTGTTVLVEEHSGRGARVCTAPFPFRCSISKQIVVQPDPTVTTLLREACSLHQSSHGIVSFADVFQRMVGWLHWQAAAAVLAREAHAQAAASSRAVSAPAIANDTPLMRLVSTDGAWPSSDYSALSGSASSGTRENINSSHMATPVTTSPDMRHTHGSNMSGSWLVYHRDSSLEHETVEEALLPGSMGGAGGWAHTANTTANATGGAGSIASTTAIRTASTPATSMLFLSQGLVQPPSAFTSASPTAANPTKAPSSSPLKLFQWLRSSPTSSCAGTAHSHPILSPATLGQMYSTDGVGGGQLSRLLTGDDDDDEGCLV
ncbi:hypothetical protein LSCM1_04753 [Leishmania martiniquensis]|uniref:Uncharacterized protein n=1 Tax=Leishmania martiniquensis TaxID=1580590 RepID=A0A836GSX0_9TRYP|nr:hypothetical protein LSCM1_04753 [Leishmania martiniquensis]